MKKIWMFAFCIFSMFPVLAKAESATLEQEFWKDVYYVMTFKNGEVIENQEAMFRLDGKIAYCLEPNIVAKAGEYQVTEGLSGSYLSKENKNKVEEFGYYGYEYPGHQTKEYYLAAQELIWETVSDYEVKWVTNLNGGIEINVEKEKQEIQRLIEENKKVPSFHLMDIHLYEDEYLELNDQNKVLDQFMINYSDFKIENGKLIANGVKKNITIKGTMNTYDDEKTRLYRQETSQKMATLRLSEPTNFQLNIIIDGTSMKIHKIGEVWKGIWNSGEWASQNGVEFKLYAEEDIFGHFGNILYKKGDYIETLVTKNGYTETKKLPDGTYRLVETKAKEKYRIIEPIIFEINNSVEKNPTLEIKNEFSTGKVEIDKKDEKGMPLAGVIFGLYSKGGKKLDEQVTDEEGKIVWERLPVGEYQIRELETLEGFILDSTKEKIKVKDLETLKLEKINVPLLPNTSGRKHGFQFIVGIFGLFVGKRFLC